MQESADKKISEKEKLEEKQNQGKKNRKVLSIILSIVLFVVAFFAGFLTNNLFLSENARFAKEVVSLMDRVGYIYDEKSGSFREITKEDIGDALVNGVLDQYSAYYTVDEYEQVNQTSKGNYAGIGVAFYGNDSLVIDLVMFNSPLDRAGVKRGDRLISATENGKEEVVFSSVNHALITFQNIEENKDFKIKYSRDGVEDEVVIKKEKYVRSYVYYLDNEKEFSFRSLNNTKPVGTEKDIENSIITDNSVGYICFDNFSGNAFNEMKEALEYMKARGKTKLILDLRDNGGGYMNVLTDIASLFIYNGGAKKSLVAVSQGKKSTENYYTTKNNFQNFIQDLVILGNENTASASECLIGAIVHYNDTNTDISKVVVEQSANGEYKTYGKGIMQTTYKLIGGDAFKLTTAKITWPDRETCIHNKGINQSMGCSIAERGKGIEKALEMFND